MTPGQVINLISLAGPSLTKRGLLDASGNWATNAPMLEAEDIALVVQDVEAGLKAQGVVIPPQVDKAIQVLPAALLLIAQIIG